MKNLKNKINGFFLFLRKSAFTNAARYLPLKKSLYFFAGACCGTGLGKIFLTRTFSTEIFLLFILAISLSALGKAVDFVTNLIHDFNGIANELIMVSEANDSFVDFITLIQFANRKGISVDQMMKMEMITMEMVDVIKANEVRSVNKANCLINGLRNRVVN